MLHSFVAHGDGTKQWRLVVSAKDFLKYYFNNGMEFQTSIKIQDEELLHHGVSSSGHKRTQWG
jgi:hypothetical protein